VLAGQERKGVKPWIQPNAPRFHAVLERREGRRILMLSRHTWTEWQIQPVQPVLLTTTDLEETPLATAPSFLLATARRSACRAEVSIYRADLSDTPNLINVDTYEVWEHLRSRVNVTSIVNAASTSTGTNLDRYLDDHVFLASEQPGADHHVPALPGEVVALLKLLGAG
jgi:hypothetical protein